MAEETNEQQDEIVEGSEEHRQQLRDIADGKIKPPDEGRLELPPKERPPEVPEKFWDAEKGQVRQDELLKSYLELEKKLGQPKSKAAVAIESSQEDGLPDDADVPSMLRHIGLDPEKLTQTFLEKGELAAEDYRAIREKLNVPRGVVDRVLRLEQVEYETLQEKLRSTAINKAGGEEQLAQLLEWGKANLSEAEIAKFNEDASKIDTVGYAMDWLLSRYNAAVGAGNASPLLSGAGAPSPLTAVASRTELLSLMSDERYRPMLPDGQPNPKFDAEFRRNVLARLAKTDIENLPEV